METFADRLTRAMTLKNMTPGMLSIKTGISDKMIRNYKNGKTSLPGSYSAKLLARALGVSIDWLLGIEEDKNHD